MNKYNNLQNSFSLWKFAVRFSTLFAYFIPFSFCPKVVMDVLPIVQKACNIKQ